MSQTLKQAETIKELLAIHGELRRVARTIHVAQMKSDLDRSGLESAYGCVSGAMDYLSQEVGKLTVWDHEESGE